MVSRYFRCLLCGEIDTENYYFDDMAINGRQEEQPSGWFGTLMAIVAVAITLGGCYGLYCLVQILS